MRTLKKYYPLLMTLLIGISLFACGGKSTGKAPETVESESPRDVAGRLTTAYFDKVKSCLPEICVKSEDPNCMSETGSVSNESYEENLQGYLEKNEYVVCLFDNCLDGVSCLEFESCVKECLASMITAAVKEVMADPEVQEALVKTMEEIASSFADELRESGDAGVSDGGVALTDEDMNAFMEGFHQGFIDAAKEYVGGEEGSQ